MRINIKILLLILIFSVGTAQAATYYAGPSGSGTTCSDVSPCTLTYAIETKAQSGDTVYLQDGNYGVSTTIDVPEGVSITAVTQGVGGWGARVYPTANMNTSTPMFDLSSSAGSTGNQSISYIEFDGIDGSYEAEVAIKIRSRNSVTINNNYIHDFYGGWDSSAIDVRSADRAIGIAGWWDFWPADPGVPGDDSSIHALWPDNPVTGLEIAYNTIYDCGYFEDDPVVRHGSVRLWMVKDGSVHDNNFSNQTSRGQFICGVGSPDMSSPAKTIMAENFDIYNNSFAYGQPYGADRYDYQTISSWSIEGWLWIGGCQIYNNTSAGPYGSTWYSITYGKETIIRDNYISIDYNSDPNIWEPARGVGIGIEFNGQSYGQILRNFVAGAKWGTIVGHSLSRNKDWETDYVLVADNVFYSTRWEAIRVSCTGALGGSDNDCSVKYVDVVGNTIYGTRDSITGHDRGTVGLRFVQAEYLVGKTCVLDNVRIRNNIVYGQMGPAGSFTGTVTNRTVQNTLGYNNDTNDWIGITDTGFKVGNPDFVAAGTRTFNSYRLNAGSPAIDAGVALPSYYTGTPRAITGTLPDIGAHEYGSTPQAQPPVVTIDTPSGSQDISVNDSLSFTCTATDSDGTVVSYLWDFDDSGIAQSTSEDPGSQQFTSEGTYTITVTVTDDDGLTGSDSLTVTVGTPAGITGPIFEWNLEAADIVDDEGSVNQNLTNNGSITTGGTEPDPPGYGSVGAVLNGSTQYFSVTNANYGNRGCSGGDDECTIYVGFRQDVISASDEWIAGVYDYGADQRSWVIGIQNGIISFRQGYNSGNSNQELELDTKVFSAGEDIILGIAFNPSASEYRIKAYEVDTGLYHEMTQADTALTGTYHSSTSAPFGIGVNFNDGTPGQHFDGTIWFVHIYDEVHNNATMEEVIENSTAASTTITRCWIGEDKTYTTDDVITVYCESNGDMTVNKTGGTPFLALETGGTDLECALQTANGSGLRLLTFTGTVLAGMTTGGSELDATSAYAIDENSGSITGLTNLNIPSSGVGSIPYESTAYVDTSPPTIDTMQAVDCDTGDPVTTDVIWHRGEEGCIEIAFSDGAYFVDGQVGNFMLPFVLDTGGPLQMTYKVPQPSGHGIGTSAWVFSATITGGMDDLDGGIALSDVGDLDRDFITTGTDSSIENAAGANPASYNMPQTAIDSNYNIRVRGGAIVRRVTNAAGSVTFVP
jgi:hypothetical protein